MITSEKIDVIMPAMARAWANFPEITRNAVGSIYKEGKHVYDWKYASYDHILELIKPHLAAEGLMLLGGLEYLEDEPGSFMQQVIWHGESQQKYGHRIRIREAENPQAWASQVSYKMRYGLGMLFQLAAADDDDGNAAQGQQQVRNDDNPFRSQSRRPDQGARPAGQAAPPAASPGTSRPPGLLAPPPEKGVISTRINESQSVEDVEKFLDGIVSWLPVAHHPALWPRIMAAVVARLDKGATSEKWDPLACDMAEDKMNAIWPQVAANAIKAIGSPKALTRWVVSLRDDYYGSELEAFRFSGHYREIVRAVLHRATTAQTEEGWDADACNVLAEEISKCKPLINELELQEKNHADQQQDTTQGSDAAQGSQAEAEGGDEAGDQPAE